MTIHALSGKTDRIPAVSGIGKSIFPNFNVNVPMPKDTAVPGSFNKPVQQSSSSATTSSNAK